MRGVWLSALALALALLCAPAVEAQQILPGFPPGVFQDRAALDASGGVVTPTYSYNFPTSGVIDSGNMTYTGSLGTYIDSSAHLVAATTNAARFDYSPTSVGTPVGLLIEEPRKNYLLQSNGFGTTWGPVHLTQSKNVTGIDGTTSAWTFTAAAGSYQAVTGQSITSNGTFSETLYVKKGTWNYIFLMVQGQTANYWATAIFDLNAGAMTQSAVGTTGGTIASTSVTPAGNSFYRIDITGTVAGLANYNPQFGFANTATGNSFDTYGQPVARTWAGTETFIATDAQIEFGNSPTSYVPTTTATVTRTADVLQLTGGALATCLGGAAGSVAVKTPDGQAATVGTLLSENGVVELGETAANKATTAVGTALTSSNTATWTGANDTGLSWSTTAGLIDLNATVTSDAVSRAPGANFYLGSNAGTSAFWNGHFTSIACYNTYQAAPQ